MCPGDRRIVDRVGTRALPYGTENVGWAIMICAVEARYRSGAMVGRTDPPTKRTAEAPNPSANSRKIAIHESGTPSFDSVDVAISKG
jgi:hypothetical protein